MSQPCARSQNPAKATLKDFYQRFNSLDTSPASYYHRIPVGWCKELFPTSQSAFVCELGIWVKLSIRLFSQYTTGRSGVHVQVFGKACYAV